MSPIWKRWFSAMAATLIATRVNGGVVDTVDGRHLAGALTIDDAGAIKVSDAGGKPTTVSLTQAVHIDFSATAESARRGGTRQILAPFTARARRNFITMCWC